MLLPSGVSWHWLWIVWKSFLLIGLYFFLYVVVLVDIESLHYGQQCFSHFPLLFWETLCPWLMSFAVQLDRSKKPLSCCISSWRVTVCDCRGEKQRIDDSQRKAGGCWAVAGCCATHSNLEKEAENRVFFSKGSRFRYTQKKQQYPI